MAHPPREARLHRRKAGSTDSGRMAQTARRKAQDPAWSPRLARRDSAAERRGPRTRGEWRKPRGERRKIRGGSLTPGSHPGRIGESAPRPGFRSRLPGSVPDRATVNTQFQKILYRAQAPTLGGAADGSRRLTPAGLRLQDCENPRPQGGIYPAWGVNPQVGEARKIPKPRRAGRSLPIELWLRCRPLRGSGNTAACPPGVNTHPLIHIFPPARRATGISPAA